MPGELYQVDYDRNSPNAKEWERINFIIRRIYALLDQKGSLVDNSGEEITNINHNKLNNLAYAASGHTGFAPEIHGHSPAQISPQGEGSELDADTVDGKHADHFFDRQSGFPGQTEGGEIFFDLDGSIGHQSTPRTFYIYGQYEVHVREYTISKDTLITEADYIQISDTTGEHFIYYDSDGVLHESTTVPPAFEELFYNNAYVAAIYWNATTGEIVMFGDERHGTNWPWSIHAYEHITEGARYLSGLGIAVEDIDGSGNDESAARISVSAGVIQDEDLRWPIVDGDPQTLSPIAQIPVLFKSGMAGAWMIKAADDYPLVYSDGVYFTGANGRLPWNQNDGGNWILSEVGNNDYVLVHYLATNDIRNPIIGVTGQASYGTVGQARAGALVEVNNLVLFGLPFQEFVFIGTVIYQTVNTYSNVPKARTRTTDNGGDYVDWRTDSITPAGVPSSLNHAALANLAFASSGHTGFAPDPHNNDAHSETYLTTETDPVFGASEAALFEAGDKALLDSALQSESDPVFGAWLATDPLADFLTEETDPVVGAVDGIVMADGAGNISAATAGTDYQEPLDEDNLGALVESFTEKAVPDDADYMLLSDSEDDDKAKKISVADLADAIGGGGGTTDHSALDNLAYADAGHTGFAPDPHGNEAHSSTFSTFSGSYGDLSDIPSTFAPASHGNEAHSSVFLTSAGVRELLTADRTYYVRTDGDDGNDGLTDSAGGAFLTIQKAINEYQALDCNGYNVYIYVRAGTYTGSALITSRIGAGDLYLIGDTTTPSNVHLNYSGADGAVIYIVGHPSGSTVFIGGFKISSTTSAIYVFSGSRATINGAMEFGACTAYHLFVSLGSYVVNSANWTISGGCVRSLYVNRGAFYHCPSAFTFTFTGSPNISGSFVYVVQLAQCLWFNATFTGTVTGRRYYVDFNAIIWTGTGADPNYFPGNAAGVSAYGGQYI